MEVFDPPGHLTGPSQKKKLCGLGRPLKTTFFVQTSWMPKMFKINQKQAVLKKQNTHCLRENAKMSKTESFLKKTGRKLKNHEIMCSSARGNAEINLQKLCFIEAIEPFRRPKHIKCTIFGCVS